MVWFIEVNGLPMDARPLPLDLQAVAFRRGYTPYIPALGPKAPLPSCIGNVEHSRISCISSRECLA